jgi:hypothetical protein
MTKLDDLTLKLDRTLGIYKGLSEDSQGRVVNFKRTSVLPKQSGAGGCLQPAGLGGVPCSRRKCPYPAAQLMPPNLKPTARLTAARHGTVTPAARTEPKAPGRARVLCRHGSHATRQRGHLRCQCAVHFKRMNYRVDTRESHRRTASAPGMRGDSHLHGTVGLS